MKSVTTMMKWLLHGRVERRGASASGFIGCAPGWDLYRWETFIKLALSALAFIGRTSRALFGILSRACAGALTWTLGDLHSDCVVPHP